MCDCCLDLQLNFISIYDNQGRVLQLMFLRKHTFTQKNEQLLVRKLAIQKKKKSQGQDINGFYVKVAAHPFAGFGFFTYF